MEENFFNLLHEPWIMVINREGEPNELSLLTVLERAHEIRCLAGELPSQDVAILRLILAVLYATFTRVDVDGQQKTIKNRKEALERWKGLWDLKRFPMGPIKKRLCLYEERFFLFHPEWPFYQVYFKDPPADENGATIDFTQRYARELIGDVAECGDKSRLFTGRTVNNKILFSEAARWLLNILAFDVAPAGRPSRERITVKGYGLPWVSGLGVVWLEGNNLFETFMLNFVLVDQKEEPWKISNVYWETNEACTADMLKDIGFHRPKNPAELFTMQFRRIQLECDEKEKYVTGFKLWSGIKADYDKANYEIMTTWKKGKEYEPQKHIAGKQMWRDFSALISLDEEKKVGVLRWINTLKGLGYLETPFLELHSVGVEFKQNTALKHIFSDSLKINSNILSQIGDKWVIRISDLLQITDKCVDQLKYLAKNLSIASGDSGNSWKKRRNNIGTEVRVEAYYRMDVPFRNWLARIDPIQSDMDKAEQEWKKTLKLILFKLGEELAYQFGEKAIIGRWVEEKRGSRRESNLYTAPGALAKFRRNVAHTIAKGG